MYRKFSADQFFSGKELLAPRSVLITDQAGTVIDLVNKEDAGDDVQHFQGMLSPGFVNSHCHLELSHMKGVIPQQRGLVDFVLEIIKHRNAPQEKILSAIEAAENEMFENGIVAVGDICNTNHTIAQKIKSRLQYYNFIETSGFPPAVAEIRFQQIEELYKEFVSQLQNVSIVPHAPYSVSTSLLNKIVAHEESTILSMHNQEAVEENELFIDKSGDFLRLYDQLNINTDFFNPPGKTSLQYLIPYFKKSKPTILVHNVHTSEADVIKSVSYFDTSSLYYCLCVNANLYINNALPTISHLIQHDCNIVIGTDSLASNNQLSILEEINTIKKHFPALSMSQLLQWATINGAKALGIDDLYGSFEKGKRPGVIVINENKVKRLL